MADVVLLYEIFSDQAILSGGSWQLPLSNLQTADIAQVARSTNAANSSTIINFNLGSIQPIGGVAFGPANLSPGATWRLRLYSNAAMTVLTYDSGLLTVTGEVINWADPNQWLDWENPGFWNGVADYLSFNELPQFNYHIIPVASAGLATQQYGKIEIFDTGNANGYAEIGRLAVARAFRPTHNYDGNELTIIPLVDVEESLGGKRDYWERGLRRSFRMTWPRLPQSELFDQVLRLMIRSSISKHVFVVPDPDDTSYGKRRSFLATMSKIPAIQQLVLDEGTTGVDLEEVL